jgi:hypothetical protein
MFKAEGIRLEAKNSLNNVSYTSANMCVIRTYAINVFGQGRVSVGIYIFLLNFTRNAA